MELLGGGSLAHDVIKGQPLTEVVYDEGVCRSPPAFDRVWLKSALNTNLYSNKRRFCAPPSCALVLKLTKRGQGQTLKGVGQLLLTALYSPLMLWSDMDFGTNFTRIRWLVKKIP